ncbi:C40 family peptidase [uncultured Pontibacter sp.]|uniref:C40 family peptidase n=1 Tax=uncultured Pontibacter sp. TaxID=453356 RepID=UPI0026137902|nr:C40 family peptidase [uncultured Pontibacter sp.]
MKKTLLFVISPIILLVLLFVFVPQHFAHPATSTAEVHNVDYSPASVTDISKPSYPTTETSGMEASSGTDSELVEYALSLMGTPYIWAGETPDGFDCSGFITHVYDKYDVSLPHSSRMQSEEGKQVLRHEAQPGDLVIFTGTNPQVREPGHVGIVISQPNDTIEFVHSSSNGGVKISQVEGSGYEVRFLEIRRVL